MRCPNPDCREPFVVEEAKAKKKGSTAPKPSHSSGAVGDVVPVVEAEPVPKVKVKPPKSMPTVAPDLPPIFEDPEEAEVVEAQIVEPPSSKPAPPPKPRPAPPPKAVEAKVVGAQVAAPPASGPREVVWSPDADLPGGPPAPPPAKPKVEEFEVVHEEAVEEPEEEVEIFVRKRKKKRNLAPIILIGMLVSIVVIGGGIAAYVITSQKQSEELEAQEALAQFDKADYGSGTKSYAALVEKYPNSPHVEKYRFMADLCGIWSKAAAVTSADDPKIAMDSIKTFIQVHRESPYAKPGEYGQSVYAAGHRVMDDVKKHADDRLAAYAADRRTKRAELKKAEDALTLGEEFLPLLREFRTKDAKSIDDLREPITQARAAIAKERKRLEILSQARKLAENPTDPVIQELKNLFEANGLPADDEALEIIRGAEASFLKAIRYEREPLNPQPPVVPVSSLVFVAPVGPTKPAARGVDDVPTVFLAVANGVVYALDEDTGDLLWSVRVGTDVFDPPTVASVVLQEGPTDLALVTSNVAAKPALTAYVLRTGQPKWSQPLTPRVAPGGDESKLPPSPAAGPAVVIAGRAYVPIRDASGSVLVYDIATGMKLGRITVGQAISPGAFARPGTSHLYIAAESRRLFLFDVEPVASGGEARCLRVLPTDHGAGTLRTIPSILGQSGEDPSPRFLILSQADGAGMKLRAIPLPPTPVLLPEAPPLLEPLPQGVVELPLVGWATFPPVSDSERLTVVTDRNQFRIFGINQPGNQDAALFALPSPTIPEPPEAKPIRGLVVPAEEGAYWVLVNGSLLKFRLTLVPDRGLTLVPAGAGLPIGEPTQPAQMNLRRDTACFVVRSASSSGCRAVAVKLRDGEPRWQRQLGMIPASAPIRTSTGVLLVDGDGGAVSIPASAGAKAAPEWIVAPPLDGLTRPTVVAATPDGATVFTLAPVGEGAVAKWIIRRIVNGKIDHTGTVNAPGSLTGRPVVFNGSLLIPASDGFIHRLVLGDGRGVPDTLALGPKWLSRSIPNAACFITVVSNDQFIASDGDKALRRWTWSAGATAAETNATWSLRERVANAPAVLAATAGKPARMLAADTTGSVVLFGLDRSENLLRRWVPGVTAALPRGIVSEEFAFQTDASGRTLAAYSVKDKHIVCLNLDADEPRWVANVNDDPTSLLVGSPIAYRDGRWLVTDLCGRVTLLDAEGQPALIREIGLPGTVPLTAGVPLGESRAIVPLHDGSAALVELEEKPKGK